MASQPHSARHIAARNIILLWLGGAIAIAGIGILITYHQLRDEPMQLAAPEPLLSKRNATKPIRSPLIPEKLAAEAKAAEVPALTAADNEADIARAHQSAVEEAKSAKAAPEGD